MFNSKKNAELAFEQHEIRTKFKMKCSLKKFYRVCYLTFDVQKANNIFNVINFFQCLNKLARHPQKVL